MHLPGSSRDAAHSVACLLCICGGQPQSELGGRGLGRHGTRPPPEELHMPQCGVTPPPKFLLPAGLLQKGLNEPGGLLGAPSELSLANVTKSGRVSTFILLFSPSLTEAAAESGGQLFGACFSTMHHLSKGTCSLCRSGQPHNPESSCCYPCSACTPAKLPAVQLTSVGKCMAPL